MGLTVFISSPLRLILYWNVFECHLNKKSQTFSMYFNGPWPNISQFSSMKIRGSTNFMCFRNVVRRILELEYSKKLCWERQARGCNGHRRELHVTIVEVYLTILLVFVSLQSLQPDNQITHRVRASERAAGANKLVAFFCCYANKKNAGKNCLAKHTFASSCNYYVLVYIVLGWAPTAWLPLHQERCKKNLLGHVSIH